MENRLLVVLSRDLEDNEVDTIGIASNTENALRMIDEYFGTVGIEKSNFRDVRDSGLEFDLMVRDNEDYLGGDYLVWAQDFKIDEIQ